MRGAAWVLALVGLVHISQGRISLRNEADACGCWTAEYVALEGITVSGDLHLEFELGVIPLSSGQSLRIQLRHASGEDGSGSRWTVPQVNQGLSRDARGNWLWRCPKGASVMLGSRISGVFAPAADGQHRVRKAADGRMEVRCPHGFTYRFRGYSLDEIETGTGEVLRATGRGGVIERLVRIGADGAEEVVLDASYDRYVRLTAISIGPRHHGFEYGSETRRMEVWTSGDVSGQVTRFRYDAAGFLSCLEGARSRAFEWARSPVGVARVGPGAAREYRIQQDGDLRYTYEASDRIVTLAAIGEGGREQRLYYNTLTGNIDLFDP